MPGKLVIPDGSPMENTTFATDSKGEVVLQEDGGVSITMTDSRDEPARQENDGVFLDRESRTTPEMNPKFQDVAETGTWGDIGTREVIRVLVVGVLLKIGMAVAIYFSMVPGEDLRPLSPALKLEIALQTFDSSQFTRSAMPRNVDFFKDLALENSTIPAHYRAIRWYLFEDEFDIEQESSEPAIRVVLASLYYHLGGASWNNSTNWLSSERICDWNAVECERGKFVELRLDRNNLTGIIPNEIGLLQDVSTIWLNQNNLEGTIPGGPLAELPKLTALFLADNRLSGTIPEELGESSLPCPVKDTVYVQHNDLTGDWPFCRNRCKDLKAPLLWSHRMPHFAPAIL
eukprot:scaffold6638_cov127-Cylindrotheca_fusiformis.AAC.37